VALRSEHHQEQHQQQQHRATSPFEALMAAQQQQQQQQQQRRPEQRTDGGSYPRQAAPTLQWLAPTAVAAEVEASERAAGPAAAEAATQTAAQAAAAAAAAACAAGTSAAASAYAAVVVVSAAAAAATTAAAAAAAAAARALSPPSQSSSPTNQVPPPPLVVAVQPSAEQPRMQAGDHHTAAPRRKSPKKRSHRRVRSQPEVAADSLAAAGAQHQHQHLSMRQNRLNSLPAQLASSARDMPFDDFGVAVAAGIAVVVTIGEADFTLRITDASLPNSHILSSVLRHCAREHNGAHPNVNALLHCGTAAMLDLGDEIGLSVQHGDKLEAVRGYSQRASRTSSTGCAQSSTDHTHAPYQSQSFQEHNGYKLTNEYVFPAPVAVEPRASRNSRSSMCAQM
jgi:hypothetical protein